MFTGQQALSSELPDRGIYCFEVCFSSKRSLDERTQEYLVDPKT